MKLSDEGNRIVERWIKEYFSIDGAGLEMAKLSAVLYLKGISDKHEEDNLANITEDIGRSLAELNQSSSRAIKEIAQELGIGVADIVNSPNLEKMQNDWYWQELQKIIDNLSSQLRDAGCEGEYADGKKFFAAVFLFLMG